MHRYESPPNWTIDISTNYVNKVRIPKDSVLHKAFTNLTYRMQSDDQSSNKVNLLFLLSLNKYYTAHTCVTIPSEEFNSVEDETFLVTLKGTVLLETIQQTMTTETFKLSP